MLSFLASRAAGVARGSLYRLLAAEAPRGIVSSSIALQKGAPPKAPAPKAPAPPAAAAGNEEDDDLVMLAFKEQQRHFRELTEGAKHIPVPLDGDDAAIQKYADQMQALKAKIGMPGFDEKIDATLEFKFKVAGTNVRRYLQVATEDVQLTGPMADVIAEVGAAVDKIEAETGAPLDESNNKGWEMLKAQVAAISKKAGLDDADAIKKATIFNMYKSQVAELRAKVEEDMETVKRRDGLEWVDVDLASLKQPSAA